MTQQPKAIPLSLQVALQATLRTRDDLVRALQALPREALAWQPGGVTRNSLHIVSHCAATNLFFASTFAGTPLPYRTEDERAAAMEACDTLEKAEAFLDRSVAAVCDAIVTTSEARLTELMMMPWGERIPVALALLTPSYHMQNHEGQINFIQSLLGDDEYH